jgi:hypothetical protein
MPRIKTKGGFGYRKILVSSAQHAGVRRAYRSTKEIRCVAIVVVGKGEADRQDALAKHQDMVEAFPSDPSDPHDSHILPW